MASESSSDESSRQTGWSALDPSRWRERRARLMRVEVLGSGRGGGGWDRRRSVVDEGDSARVLEKKV